MKLADIFASRLHELFMKPDGFRRKGRSFFRGHADYMEYYQLQGSAWNSPDRPWRFYVNCGVGFPGLPIHGVGTGVSGVHAATRLTVFVREAPPQYDLIPDNLEALVVQIGAHLRRCSAYFARRHEVLRESYQARHYHLSFLHDPELQNG